MFVVSLVLLLQKLDWMMFMVTRKKNGGDPPRLGGADKGAPPEEESQVIADLTMEFESLALKTRARKKKTSPFSLLTVI